MFNELSYELADVRTALRALEKRVDTVERLALADSENQQGSSERLVVVESAHQEAPLKHLAVTNSAQQQDSLEHVTLPDSAQQQETLERNLTPSPMNGGVELNSSGNSDQPCDSATIENFSEEFKSTKEGLEVFVGRHLNKLGISFLVIGCALALIYQFQYFAPALKILSGLIAGALLIWGGETFEKKDAKMAWYGRALIGGGWALSYFSIFAAHYFDSVRIIESAVVDFSLLFAVASGAIFSLSLKYKSETITGITLTLAFGTICLSPATSFSVLACALLVAALVGLCFKMNWFNLFVYGECVFYAVYLGFILPQIMQGQNAFFGMNSADGNFFTAIACSLFCWMAMNVVIFTSKVLKVGERNRLVLATLINCAAFVPPVLNLMAGSHEDMKFGFLLATGAAYLISTMTAGQSTAGGPLACNRILGLSLVTLSVPLKLTGDWLSAFLSLEVPVLVWAGLQYEIPSVRIFAAILACSAAGSTAATLLSSVFSSSSATSMSTLLSGALAFTAYGVTAFLYEVHRRKGESLRNNRWAFHFYFSLAAGIAMAVFTTPLLRTWIAAAVVFESMFTVLIGLKLADKTLRIARSNRPVFIPACVCYDWSRPRILLEYSGASISRLRT